MSGVVRDEEGRGRTPWLIYDGCPPKIVVLICLCIYHKMKFILFISFLAAFSCIRPSNEPLSLTLSGFFRNTSPNHLPSVRHKCPPNQCRTCKICEDVLSDERDAFILNKLVSNREELYKKL